MTKRQSFTPAAIEALREGKMNHPDVPGLAVYASGSGRLAKRTWRYQRRVPKSTKVYNATLGGYPAFSIGDARAWAESINEAIEAGRDPTAAKPENEEQSVGITVNEAHALYMRAVSQNKHRVRKMVANPIKPRTISDKKALYKRHVEKAIGHLPVNDITPAIINDLVIRIRDRTVKGVAANRLGAELNVFFKWCQGLVGAKYGIKLADNPTKNVAELWVPEETRERVLDVAEIKLLLRALKGQEDLYKKPILMWLLTGCRLREIVEFPMSDYQDGLMIISAQRSKNHREHPIALGPWGRALMPAFGDWLVPSYRRDGPMIWSWPEAINRIRVIMEDISGTTVPRFTAHDLRRTFRTHIDDIVDEDIAERMMNHTLGGLVKRYNRNKRAASMAAGFDAWDRIMQGYAREVGVADQLGVPPLTLSCETATPSV